MKDKAAGLFTEEENTLAGELRALLLSYFAEHKDDLFGKSSDGAIRITTPTWWESSNTNWEVQVWHYPFGEGRSTIWEAETLKGALEKALSQIRAWIDEEKEDQL